MKSDLSEVTESNFKTKVIDSPMPVVVEFGAEWCRPCKALEPVLKKLSAEWTGKASLVQIDVDQAQSITQQYMILSVPTILLFIKGQAVERLTGFQPEEKLRRKLEPHLL